MKFFIKIFCYMILFFSIANGAQSKEIITVQALDPYYPVDQMGLNYRKEESDSQLGKISPYERDIYFQETGIASLTNGWDHFEKDILVMRIRSQSLREVKLKYPQIPIQQLIALKKLLQP